MRKYLIESVFAKKGSERKLLLAGNAVNVKRTEGDHAILEDGWHVPAKSVMTEPEIIQTFSFSKDLMQGRDLIKSLNETFATAIPLVERCMKKAEVWLALFCLRWQYGYCPECDIDSTPIPWEDLD